MSDPVMDFDVDSHDPGGKVSLPLLPGMFGAAQFSVPGGKYRYWLYRDWSDDRPADSTPFAVPSQIRSKRFILWIGMNPSTAQSYVDDPTIRREIEFSRRAGLTRYLKCNVMDYRATHPNDLRGPGVTPCSDVNRGNIQEWAQAAYGIVACWGKTHKSHRKYIDNVRFDLRRFGAKVVCLGRNSDGSPKHPLYLSGDTSFEPFFQP